MGGCLPCCPILCGMSVANRVSRSKEYDVFISHATEDKDHFVRPLAEALVAKGLRVWYDEFELRIGDSLREKIDLGLVSSRFGVVVISPSFFQKNWPQYELDGLTARQMSGERVILPVWHRITKDEILNQCPSLADIVASNSSTHTIGQIADAIATRITVRESQGSPSESAAPTTPVSGPNFAVFYVASAHTEELPPDETPKPSFLSFADSHAPWVSMVSGDKELEYILDQTQLRVRLDWGHGLEGDEIKAHHLVSGDQPFAMTIRLADAEQIYLPAVVNTSPSPFWRHNPSGWMSFRVLK